MAHYSGPNVPKYRDSENLLEIIQKIIADLSGFKLLQQHLALWHRFGKQNSLIKIKFQSSGNMSPRGTILKRYNKILAQESV